MVKSPRKFWSPSEHLSFVDRDVVSSTNMCVISCSKRDALVMRVVPDTRRFTRLAKVGAREDRRSEPRGKTEEDGGERYSRMLYGWLSKLGPLFGSLVLNNLI